MNTNSKSQTPLVKPIYKIISGFVLLFFLLTSLHFINKNDFESVVNFKVSSPLNHPDLNENTILEKHFDKFKGSYCFLTHCENLEIQITDLGGNTYSLKWRNASNRSAKDDNYFENKLEKHANEIIEQKVKSILIIEESQAKKYSKRLSLNEVKLAGFNKAHNLTGNETPLTHIAIKLKSLSSEIASTENALNHAQGNSQETVKLKQSLARLNNEKKEIIKPLINDSNLYKTVAKQDELSLEIKNLKEKIKEAKSNIETLKNLHINVVATHTIL